MNPASKPETSRDGTGEIGAGHILGRYELLLPIASGGMAMVWAARQTGSHGFQKIVAVKTMLPKLCEDDQFEQMFLAEASLASQIHHPHVVEILDLGEHEGILFLVMEWLDGIALNQLMKAAKKKGGVPLPIAVRIMMQACAGLHVAHELKDRKGQLQGLVHRDVSPQNIMISYDGVTKVLDFGIAKATAMGDGATVAGQIKGKVAYMAPEQVKGGSIDRRVDIFAAGIVLYALTTGKHPLRRETEAATMYNICSPDPVMAPSKIIAGYPAPLERVVMTALAKDPAKRYATANDFLRALDQALPANLRASTDEDVGAFIKSLFGDRREEREAALTEALELADKQRESRVDAALMQETSGTVTPVSSVSLSGPGDGVTAVEGQMMLQPPKRRLAVAAAVGAFVIVTGLSTVALLRSGGETTTIIRVPAPSAAAAAPAPEPAKDEPKADTSAEAEEDDAPSVNLEELAAEGEGDAPKPSRIAGGGKWKAPVKVDKAPSGPKPPAAPKVDKPVAKPAAPAAAAKPAPKWDPTGAGF